MPSTPFPVLLVADPSGASQSIGRSLEEQGFAVVSASNDAAAVRLAVERPRGLILLDLDRRGGCGASLLARLRRVAPEAHLTVLSAACTEADVIRAFAAGADDVLARTTSLAEIVARATVVRRRSAQDEAIDAPRVLRFGDLVIDLRSRKVTARGTDVALTRVEFDLLAYLARHHGTAFDRDHLLEAVWASSAQWQSKATVTEHIRRLRVKLEVDPTSPRLIETVSGVGYRFASPFEAPWAEAGAVIRTDWCEAYAVVTGTTVAFVSAAMAELLDATPAELVGCDVFEFVAPSSTAAVRARHESVACGAWPRPETITVRTVLGRERTVELSSAPVSYLGQAASQVTMWPAVARQVVDDDPVAFSTAGTDAVVVTNADFVIQSFNGAAEDLYGWRETEVVGRSIFEALPWAGTPDELSSSAAALLEHGRWHGEAKQRRRDGSVVQVRATTTLLHDADGVIVGAISVNRPFVATARSAEITRPDAELVADIRRGLANGEFSVHYQSVIDLRRGAPVAVEALLRWEHPDRGTLLPASFMAAAESSGAIVGLGRFVLDAACNQLQAWRAEGRSLHLCVNLSTRQLEDVSLVDDVAAVLERTGLPAHVLWFDVTETALVIDLEGATATLERLAALGVRIAIDDFGTGWASLTYLHEFPVHALKIDRMFVHGLGSNGNDAAIVRSVVTLGRELGLVVVAEGIETAEKLDHVVGLGCTLGQGHLFGPASPAEAHEAGLDVSWLRDESLEDAADLPAPAVIAAEISDDLEAALAEIASSLEAVE